MAHKTEILPTADEGPVERQVGRLDPERDIDTADHVYHAPSGECWVVAYVRGDKLAWCGWPQGEADLADCTLTKKATPAERDKILHQMAGAMCGSDMRAAYARERLAACHKLPAD